VNFFVRLRVSTHVTTAIVERLPIPTEAMAPAAFRDIASLARLLTRRPNRDAFAALNGRVAALYQLSETEFAHVLETFPLVDADDRGAAVERFREVLR
jgi:hypothetical protein